jgi:hypothetical protein
MRLTSWRRFPSPRRRREDGVGLAPVRRLCAASLVILSLSLVANPVRAEEGRFNGVGRVAVQAFDAVVLRPLGAGATVAGFAFFLIAAPMSAPSGRVGEGWDLFVMTPYEQTFRRPLGSLDDGGSR